MNARRYSNQACLMNKIMIMGLLLAVPAIANADDEKAVEPAPQWYLAEIQKLSAGSGRWVADNSAYQTDTEPYESYVTEWVASFDGTTLRGRLFGIVQGEETPNFWEFRQYWHPGRAEVVIEQFGGQGAVGIGTMQMDNGKIRSDQSFWFPGVRRQEPAISAFSTMRQRTLRRVSISSTTAGFRGGNTPGSARTSTDRVLLHAAGAWKDRFNCLRRLPPCRWPAAPQRRPSSRTS